MAAEQKGRGDPAGQGRRSSATADVTLADPGRAPTAGAGSDATVIFHDLEYGNYDVDLPHWTELAARYGDPVLDIGAGTGRVAVPLSYAHTVIALDNDDRLLVELRERFDGLALACDARWLGRLHWSVGEEAGRPGTLRLPKLIIVPLHTLQLLGDQEDRQRFLTGARKIIADGGALAVTISIDDPDDAWDSRVPGGGTPPESDRGQLDGKVYESLPVAVEFTATTMRLHRERYVYEDGAPDGQCDEVTEAIEELRILTDERFAAEAEQAGWRVVDRRLLDPEEWGQSHLIVCEASR